MCVCVYMSIYMYIYVYVCVWVYIHISIYSSPKEGLIDRNVAPSTINIQFP